MPPKGPPVEGLIPSLVLWGGGKTFKRWSLMETGVWCPCGGVLGPESLPFLFLLHRLAVPYSLLSPSVPLPMDLRAAGPAVTAGTVLQAGSQGCIAVLGSWTCQKLAASLGNGVWGVSACINEASTSV